MKFIIVPLPLNEHNCVPKFHEIANNVFLKVVDMGLGVDIYFQFKKINLNIHEENYIFALRSTI
jgi:hypothetical protein